MAFGDTEDLTKLGTVDRFSTFQGVFRPITLTVLGAMLYLREGWLVGNSS